MHISKKWDIGRAEAELLESELQLQVKRKVGNRTVPCIRWVSRALCQVRYTNCCGFPWAPSLKGDANRQAHRNSCLFTADGTSALQTNVLLCDWAHLPGDGLGLNFHNKRHFPQSCLSVQDLYCEVSKVILCTTAHLPSPPLRHTPG